MIIVRLKKGDRVSVRIPGVNRDPREVLLTMLVKLVKHFSKSWSLDLANGAKVFLVNEHREMFKFVCQGMIAGDASDLIMP